jgi:hypothetical protein
MSNQSPWLRIVAGAVAFIAGVGAVVVVVLLVRATL